MARRNQVLKSVVETGDLSESLSGSEAEGSGRDPPAPGQLDPYLVDFLEEGSEAFPDSPPSGAGLRIFGTVDPGLQGRPRRWGGSGRLERSPALRKNPAGSLQGALVALRVSDGSILALVGGRDYRVSQFNRTYQAHRQPGSLFKPFVYLAGFDRAQFDPSFTFNAATPLEDSPLELVSGGKPYSPQNYDHEFHGTVTVRRALEESLNVATIRAATQVGLDHVITVARRCGAEAARVPAGARPAEVTPLGWPPPTPPRFGEFAPCPRHRANRSTSGRWSPRSRQQQGPFSPGRLFDHRPAQGSALGDCFVRHHWGFPGAAGRGTTDDLRDAWFAGYTPKFRRRRARYDTTSLSGPRERRRLFPSGSIS